MLLLGAVALAVAVAFAFAVAVTLTDTFRMGAEVIFRILFFRLLSAHDLVSNDEMIFVPGS